MRMRNARIKDIDAILALGISNKVITNNAHAPIKIRNELKNYSVLEDNMKNIIGYSKISTNSSGVTIDAICIKPSLVGRGFEHEIVAPLKRKYNYIKYNGRYAKRLGFKGGEFIHKITRSVAVNKDKLKTRKESLDGVEYLVAPVVMVKEQVLNGELLPAEEIEKSAPGWNGRPVVVYHPEDEDGNEVIANDPKVVPKYEVGKVYNVEYDSKSTKLKGELWIDISKAKRKNSDTKEALKMIQNSEELEVSTGYIVNDRLNKKGTFDGVEYNGIQRDILPDHLALLPQEIGACSWEDGAGVRNNSNKFVSWIKRLVSNLSNKNSIQQQVMNALKEEYDDFDWITDLVHDDELNKDFAIFNTRGHWEKDEMIVPQKMYAIEYSFDDDGSVVLGNTLQEVEPVQQYIPKTVQKEEEILKRHEMIVRDVIANSKGKLGRKDKSTLLNCSESALLAMLPADKRKAFATNKKSKKVVDNKLVANLFKGKKFATNEGEELFVEDLLTMAPEDVAATIEATDATELEAVATVLEDVIEVAEIVEEAGGEGAADVIASAEEVLAVVDEALGDEGMEDEDEDPATNVDTSDILDPEENPEEDTVSALETASAKRKARRNAKAKKEGKKSSMSINDYINSIPDAEARDFIKNGVAEAKAHRSKLIATLSAHKSCTFSEKELKAMETNQLEKISGMLGSTPTRRHANNSSYAARGLQTNKEQEDNLGYVPLTTNIFKKEDK